MTKSQDIKSPDPRPDPHSPDPVNRLPYAVTQRSSTAAELTVLAGLFSKGGEER